MFETYFHGAGADALASIIATGSMRPNEDHQIFFARYEWQSCLAHGADIKRRASFVALVRVHPPQGATIMFRETPGVRDTAIIQVDQPLPAEVLELYVRYLRGDEPARLVHLRGTDSISAYLQSVL
jgi:hypothetical protein